jgi:hypothetical protein
MEMRRFVSHAEAARMLQRAGYSDEHIKTVLDKLPDPIDTERDSEVLFKHGVSAGKLMERMGGSP